MSRTIRRLGVRAWILAAVAVWGAAIATTSAIARARIVTRGTGQKSTPTREVSGPMAPGKLQAPTTSRVSVDQAAPAKPQAPATPPPAAQAGGDRLIGEKECISCHEDQRKGYYGSPHHKSSDPRTPAAKLACETCHGPAGKHADDPVANKIRDFKTMKPTETRSGVSALGRRVRHRSQSTKAVAIPM